MGCDPVSIRHFQTYGVITARGGRVALDYGELRTRSDERWRRPPRNCFWCECVLVVRTGMCRDCDQLACKAQHSNDRQREEQISFHELGLLYDLRGHIILQLIDRCNTARAAFRYLSYIVASS